jgi:acetoin utilization protein AcuB
MIKVERWMKRDPVTIDENASIVDAIHLMKEKAVRRLPVMRKARVVGLVTDRMIKEYSPGKASLSDTWEVHYLLSKTKVKDVMNKEPHTVTPDTALIDAAQIIHDNKLHGLCVVDNAGALVGILTTTDIMEALIALCRSQNGNTPAK